MPSLGHDKPDITKKLAALRHNIDASILDCLVTGYERRIAELTLPDPNEGLISAAAKLRDYTHIF